MYLNTALISILGGVNGLTVTLDVFKWYICWIKYQFNCRLTVTLDVFKFYFFGAISYSIWD